MPALNILTCPRSAESNGTIYPHVNPSDNYSNNAQSYHTGQYNIVKRGKRLHDSHRFQFGFEVEKDDNICLGSATPAVRAEFHAMGYRLEKDGSLKTPDGMFPSPSAYEFISPIYELEFMQAFRNDMVKPIIKRMVDGGVSKFCGGHMALSATGMTAAEVFEGVAGFIPLLYAMYPQRTTIHYCKAKSKNVMAVAPEKYSAVFVKSGYIEFRIFPAIKNTRNLLWRAELLKVMADNFGASEKEVFLMMIDKKSSLHKHLRKVYTAAQIADKAWGFTRFAKQYNAALIEPLRIKGAEQTLSALSRDTTAASEGGDAE
jgi:hypothetical protein